MRFSPAGASRATWVRQNAELFGVVKKHVSSLLRKLGFRSRAEIAVWEVQRRG